MTDMTNQLRKQEERKERRRKYRIGEPIRTVEELLEQELIYFNGKVVHRGWFLSWQLGFTTAQIKGGMLFKAVRKENENAEAD